MEYQLLECLSSVLAQTTALSSPTGTTTPGGDEAVESGYGDAAFGWNAGFGFMGNFRMTGHLSRAL